MFGLFGALCWDYFPYVWGSCSICLEFISYMSSAIPYGGPYGPYGTHAHGTFMGFFILFVLKPDFRQILVELINLMEF